MYSQQMYVLFVYMVAGHCTVIKCSLHVHLLHMASPMHQMDHMIAVCGSILPCDMPEKGLPTQQHIEKPCTNPFNLCQYVVTLLH